VTRVAIIFVLVCAAARHARGDEPAPGAAGEPAAASRQSDATDPDAVPAVDAAAAADAALASAPQPAPAPPPEEPTQDADADEGGLGPINGDAFAYVRTPLERGDFQQVSASVWLRARPRITDAASAGIEIALDRIEAAVVGEPRFRASLREAYVSLRKHGWLLRMGQQILPWGSSDVVNPTDFLTARDFTFFVVETEKTRIGAPSLLVSKAWSHVEATVVATPRFPATILLVPPSVLPPGLTVAEPAPVEPKLENTEVATKLKLSAGTWDFALTAFSGFNHTPEFELVSADDMGAVVRQTHHRIIAGGLDTSVSLGKLVVRLEAAIIRTENHDGTDPTIQPTHGFGVFGLERPLGARVRVQAQAIARAYPRWTDPASVTGPDPATTGALQGVAAANALLLDYQDPYRPSATLRIAYLSAEEHVAVEVFGAMNYTGRDYLVRPLAGWRPNDAVAVQLGAEVYGGPQSRPLGALRVFRGVFLQTSFTF
jgi:hypothetical protein